MILGLATDTAYAASSLRKTLALPTTTRFAITFTFVIMVISSPIIILINPIDVAATTATTSNLNRVDSSDYHSTPRIPETHSSSTSSSALTPTPSATAPSTLNQDGDFTTQAALSLTRATQTSNIVDSKAYYDVSFRTSTDGGATFGSTTNLSNNAGNSAFPAIAASGNNVYVVWHDDTLGNNEILYKKSTDGGANFGDITNLSNNAGSSSNPAMAVGNNLPV